MSEPCVYMTLPQAPMFPFRVPAYWKDMEYAALGQTGLRVSKLGFGASPLGDVFGVTDLAETTRAVHCAVDLGINYFDVAPYYGNTLAESRLGAALEGHRQKIILATKCGRYGMDDFDFSAARIRRSIDESLKRLRTDYIDLFQAHDIEFVEEQQIVEEAIPAMLELQREGKARFIGITGLQLKMLRRVAEAAPVDTILSYCRYNLLIRDMDDLLTPFVKEQGIGLINASPFAMGLLTKQGPPEWHPANAQIRAAARKLPHEAALPFCLAHPIVATTLVGMSTVEQVHQNVEASARPLTNDVPAPSGIRIWPTGLAENQDYAG